MLDAMASYGVSPHGQLNMVADGRIHRYRVAGDKSGSKNGWYVFHDDGTVQAGAFGSWKTGESGTWSSRSEDALSAAEKEELRRKWREAKRERDREQAKVWQEVADKAEKIWDVAQPVIDSHAYLHAKAVQSHGCRVLKQTLVVPVRNRDGKLRSLQFIDATGGKKFLAGGEIQGGYFAMGKPEGVLCVCEGFATGASIREATGWAVAVAFNAGNLLAVVKVLREKFPALRIVVCADNDQFTEGNPGLNKAEGAAGQVGGLVVAPMFDPHELASKPTDFNDLHRLRGLEAVRTAILAAVDNVVPIASARGRKELERLIDDTMDFDELTGPIAAQVLSAGLPAPAREHLISKIAHKAQVPKASLKEIGEARDGNGGDPSSERNWIGEMNKKHAVIPIGGKVLILNREYDPSMRRPLLTFSDRTNFENRYCNRRVWDRGEEVSMGKYWMEHPGRAEYDGLVFSPGEEVPGYLNLWHGWGMEPGDGPYGTYLVFVSDVICGGDDELFEYLMSWCAWMVQYPRELPEVAIVLRGREGTGKNTFVEPLADIVGASHFLMLTSLNQVAGRFSGHLANALLILANESVWGGDKSVAGTLKSMITERIQPLEKKGQDMVMVNSYRHMIFATNEGWAVPRGQDDRHYCIVDVDDSRKGDWEYWRTLKKDLNDGGTAGLFRWLLERDLTGWHPRQLPDRLKQNGWDMKINSGGSVVQWWFDVLQRGWVYSDDRKYADEAGLMWLETAPRERVLNSYVGWCNAHRINHVEHSSTVGKHLHQWGISDFRPRKDNPERLMFYRLPTVDEARATFAQRFSMPGSVWDGHGGQEGGHG